MRHIAMDSAYQGYTCLQSPLDSVKTKLFLEVKLWAHGVSQCARAITAWTC